MKIIKYINTFAVGLPILIALLSLINEKYISTALVSTMLTGFVQIVLGLLLLYNNPKNKNLQIYIAVVILFFTLWYFNMNIFYSDFLTFILYPIPLFLAIYISVIIYKKPTI